MEMNGHKDANKEKKYVTLVSKDGYEFVVLRDATMCSPAIKSMLDPERSFVESRTGRCELHEIRYVLATASYLSGASLCSYDETALFSLRSF